MATNFPASLDTLTNPSGSNTLSSPSHASQHGNANDAIEAIQAKIGVDNSAVTTTLDYKTRIWNPVGEITMWGTNSAPTGWLICDGTAVSRTTYSGLFALIGTTYGVGDGSTTFNLPNLKGRVAVGRDSADTDWDTLGETRGTKTHTLTSAEMPSHTHVQDAHGHGQNPHNHFLWITSAVNGSHTHTYTYDDVSTIQRGSGSFSSASAPSTDTNNTGTNGSHSHDVIGNTADATATTIVTTATNQNTGGGGAHNNIQPSIVLNFIIRH
jgi:microcystin-dependent protein